jgi:hypothetical protein
VAELQAGPRDRAVIIARGQPAEAAMRCASWMWRWRNIPNRK